MPNKFDITHHSSYVTICKQMHVVWLMSLCVCYTCFNQTKHGAWTAHRFEAKSWAEGTARWWLSGLDDLNDALLQNQQCHPPFLTKASRTNGRKLIQSQVAEAFSALAVTWNGKRPSMTAAFAASEATKSAASVIQFPWRAVFASEYLSAASVARYIKVMQIGWTLRG